MSYEASKIRLIMELRRDGITDTAVLSAIERVPRDLFVPEPFRSQAYDNIPLPLSQGQTISQPFIVAYMTQELHVGERMRVLEIGTGSGYQAAILSRLCRRVYTIERYRSLLRGAQAIFDQLGLHNITTRHGDGALGWPEQAPFERIIVTAAADEAPPALLQQLTDGGVMVIPVGPSGAQEILRISRQGEQFEVEKLLPVRFVPLVEGVPRGC